MDGDDSSLIDHFNPMNTKPESSHPEQEQDRISAFNDELLACILSRLALLKYHPEQEQDRISALPDELLAHILSFLPDTKYAIRTRALSKRWQPVWTTVPNLTFRLCAPSTSGSTNCSCFPCFAKFVDKAIASYSRDYKVDKFWIELDQEYMPGQNQSTRIDAWIDFAVSRDVDELILDFDHKGDNLDIWRDIVWDIDRYLLPQSLYASRSLKVLKTWFCDAVPSGRVNWKLLKVVEIGFANLTPIIVQKILEGSPVLESLKLFQCLGIDRLDIASKKLKRLVVDNIWVSREQLVYSDYFVSGPSLQNLQISSAGFHKWKLMNLSSLLSVQIDLEIFKASEADFPEQQVVDYGETCRDTVQEILEKVCHVEELKLGNWSIQILSTMEIKGLSSPLLKCKSLVLQVRSFCERDLPGIVRLLCSSSKLERIEIDLSSSPENEEFDIHPDLGNCILGNDYWTSFKLQGGQDLLPNLKTVEIFGFPEGSYEQGGLLFDFITFLLKRAMVLQKMVIRE